MSGKRELAELDDKESVIDYSQKLAHSKYTCALSMLSMFEAKILLCKDIIHFVRNVVCGLLFSSSVQHSAVPRFHT